MPVYTLRPKIDIWLVAATSPGGAAQFGIGRATTDLWAGCVRFDILGAHIDWPYRQSAVRRTPTISFVCRQQSAAEQNRSQGRQFLDGAYIRIPLHWHYLPVFPDFLATFGWQEASNSGAINNSDSSSFVARRGAFGSSYQKQVSNHNAFRLDLFIDAILVLSIKYMRDTIKQQKSVRECWSKPKSFKWKEINQSSKSSYCGRT